MMFATMPLSRFRTYLVSVLALVLAGSAFGNTAVQSVIRHERAGWLTRHEGFVDLARKGGIAVLFVGDSITDGWRNEAKGAKAIWDREFAPHGAANFGIGGDRTQHVLWRLENGELDGIKPKVVVLMIGTNNTGFEAIARLHDGKFVHFLDIGDRFLTPDGTLPKEVMPDFLHPSLKGYEIWAAAIRAPLAALLR